MASYKPEPFPELLTPGECARALKVDERTVSRWATQGKIRSVRTLGGHHRMFRDDIEALFRGEKPGAS